MPGRMQPQAWSAAWQAGVGRSRDRYTQGVNTTTKSWEQNTTNAKPKMVANFQASMAGQFYERMVASTGDQGWRAGCIEKGVANYVASATNQNVQRKVTNYVNQAAAFYTTAQQAVRALPKMNRQDSLARVSAWMDQMEAFKNQYRGGRGF